MTVEQELLVDLNGRAAGPTYEFSPRATIPKVVNFPLPVPGTVAYDNVRGRAGDLIVIQLKSEYGERFKRKQALRTLGLKGVHSAALRNSNDVSTWGSIKIVRDMVAVIVLPSVNYGTDSIKTGTSPIDVEIQSLKYGTETKPAHLWRDDRAAYFAYEYDSDSLVTFWSSSLSLASLLKVLDSVGMQVDGDKPSSFVKLVLDESMENVAISGREGTWDSITDDIDLHRVGSAVIEVMGGFEVTWQAPHRRFYDLPTEWSSVGVNSHPPDILAVKSLCHATGDAKLLSTGECHFRTRQHGIIREHRI